MKGSFLIFCSCVLISLSLPAQKTDRILTEKTNSLLKGFNGVVGVYIKDLKKNKIVSINADTLFPTASMVKVPILLGIMDKIEKGQLQYHQEFIYKDSLLYSGSDILGAFKNNESIASITELRSINKTIRAPSVDESVTKRGSATFAQCLDA